jgi:endonuclease YncB( thermonuclease family)
MKNWKSLLLSVGLAVSLIFNALPGEKPEILVDAMPYVDAGIAVLESLENPDVTSVIDRAATNDVVRISEVLRVYDGDTFYCDIDIWPSILGENIGIRIRGIDTPEIRGSSAEVKLLAQFVRNYARDIICSAERLVLTNISRGKYFRVIADVECDGVDLASVLLEKGYALPYDGGTKPEWTAELLNRIE